MGDPDLDDQTKALQAVIDGWYESDYTHDSLAEAIIAAGWRKTSAGEEA